MALLVVAGVLRIAILGHVANGQKCVNIVDVHVDEIEGGGRDADLLDDVARDVLNNWQDEMLGHLGGTYVVEGANWVDLDSADGSTGNLAVDSGKPIAGLASTALLPGQVCALVHKNLQGSSRGTRSGRMYLGTLAENVVDDNGMLDAGFIGNLNSDLEDFKDGVNGVVVGTHGRTQNLCVVHAPADEGTSQDHISTYSVDPKVATQRRRIR